MKTTNPRTLYPQLMRRNREIEQIIRMLKKEQEKNGQEILRLVMKYDAVRQLHNRR